MDLLSDVTNLRQERETKFSFQVVPDTMFKKFSREIIRKKIDLSEIDFNLPEFDGVCFNDRPKVLARTAARKTVTDKVDIEGRKRRRMSKEPERFSRRQANLSPEISNHIEQADDSGDGSDERLVIDETQEVDYIQEARRRREEFAEFQADMEAQTKKQEEKSKKQLAELKERQARRKSERQAKLEQRRKEFAAEEESSSESDSTLVNSPDQVQIEETGNNDLVQINDLHQVQTEEAENDPNQDEDGHTSDQIEQNYNFFSQGGHNK